MIDRTNLVFPDGSPFDPAAYEVTLRPLGSEEGGGWLATIASLPGCTGDGETEMDAIADVRLAALEWADALVNEGKEIPLPRRAPVAAE